MALHLSQLSNVTPSNPDKNLKPLLCMICEVYRLHALPVSSIFLPPLLILHFALTTLASRKQPSLLFFSVLLRNLFFQSFLQRQLSEFYQTLPRCPSALKRKKEKFPLLSKIGHSFPLNFFFIKFINTGSHIIYLFCWFYFNLPCQNVNSLKRVFH